MKIHSTFYGTFSYINNFTYRERLLNFNISGSRAVKINGIFFIIMTWNLNASGSMNYKFHDINEMQ